MGTTYSAGVFFGAYVKRASSLGKTLDKYVEDAGGSPAKTSVKGVEIGEAGSQPSGDVWMTIEAKGSARSFGRGDGECHEPSMLVEDPKWRPAIAEFMAQVGAVDLAVGWHFQKSAR